MTDSETEREKLIRERDHAFVARERTSADNAALRDENDRLAGENRRLAAEVDQLRRDGPVWLRHALCCLHAQVDLTDPQDPVGAALTRAGLERLGADYGPDHVDHVAQVRRLEAARAAAREEVAQLSKVVRNLEGVGLVFRQLEVDRARLTEIRNHFAAAGDSEAVAVIDRIWQRSA